MRPRYEARRVPLAAAVAAALLAAACSNGGMTGSRPLSLTAADPPPPRAANRSGLGHAAPAVAQPSAPAGGYTWNGSAERIVEGQGTRAAAPHAGTTAVPAAAAPSAAAPPIAAASAGATPTTPPAAPPGAIVVGEGDTLYGLSRRHGVPISALIDVNRLASARLVPGQILKLPRQTRPKT